MQQLASVLIDLDRCHEAHKAAVELVPYNKAKFGLEHPRTLEALKTYAITCAMLDRLEEAKTKFEDVLTGETRVLGPDHPWTQDTRCLMRSYGFF